VANFQNSTTREEANTSPLASTNVRRRPEDCRKCPNAKHPKLARFDLKAARLISAAVTYDRISLPIVLIVLKAPDASAANAHFA